MNTDANCAKPGHKAMDRGWRVPVAISTTVGIGVGLVAMKLTGALSISGAWIALIVFMTAGLVALQLLRGAYTWIIFVSAFVPSLFWAGLMSFSTSGWFQV